MNKVFFMVSLGIIVGAMALIFVNQPSVPVTVGVPAQQAENVTSGAEGGNTAGSETGTAVATAPQQTPQSAPTPVTPETPATPETPGSATPKPDASRPETPTPAIPKPATPAPEAVKPAPSKPEPPKPAPSKPEAPRPEVTTPVGSRPEMSKPETAKPEASKPEATPTAPMTPMTPVTSKPETQASPGGVQTKKSLALVNIGLHFKGSGMALRIEADAPFSYKTFALSSPDRYVIDLVGTWNKMRAPTVPSNNMIKGARAGRQAGGPRLVLDMARAPRKHNVTWVSPTVLEIVIE